MSSRQLRKLQKQRELAQLQAASSSNENDNDSDESGNVAPIQRPKPKASIFSGFAALDNQDNEDNEDDNDEEVEPPAAPSRPTEDPARTDPPNSSSKKNKKKKKKGKKSDTKTEVPLRTDADDIDKVLQELDLSNNKRGAPAGSQIDTPRLKAYERICELLHINSYHLKVINEMRNLFGREAIAAALNEENEERARAQRQRHTPQHIDMETFLRGIPGKTLPEVTLRRNPFLPGKETWPFASTEGLTMRQFKEGETAGKHIPGTVEFGFDHDAHYNFCEQQFFQLVQMHDPMRLVHYLSAHPYHISTLIQVSKVAKQDQNSALSADLCERALFTFGRVSLSSFRHKMEEGKARLDFRRPENRQFWLAGYHYLRNLIMKGTYRTALEWTKLLFSMDLSDPYGMVHFIHPLAIRAHESKWFIDFCDSEVLDKFDTVQDYIRQTLVLARLQQKDTAGAKALLLEGMERLPWLYGGIYKTLGLDVPRAIWGMQPRDEHEELFVELYIHQTKSLWDNAQTTALLKEVASEAKEPDMQTFGFPPVVGRNVARFVYLDNTPSLMGLVPGGLLSTSPNWEFDPIPPLKEENIFSHDTQQQPWMQAQRPGLRGLDLPQDGEGLRRLLERVRRGGAPPEFERFLEEAIAEAGQDGLGDEDADEEVDVDELAEAGAEAREGGHGVFQVLMDLFNPGRNGGGGEGGHQRPDDGWDNSELENRMPGAWGSDSDDEMPELLPDGENDARGDATNDELER
jgi:hypothetical protein